MKNLAKIIELLFKRISPEEVINGNLHGLSIDEKSFTQLSDAYVGEYSKTELRNLWYYYRDTMNLEKSSRGITENTSAEISAFDGLFYYVKRVLTIQNSEVVCQYRYFMDWRMLTFELNEESLIAAYIAQSSTPVRELKNGYAWKTVIGHNNTALNRIFEQGLAENHFHLYGSAPIFHISWISLMNNIKSSSSANILNMIDANRLSPVINYNASLEDRPLAHKIYQAALIRLYLFANEMNIRLQIGTYYVEANALLKKCGFRKKWSSIFVDVTDLMDRPREYNIFAPIKRRINTIRNNNEDTKLSCDEEEILESMFDGVTICMELLPLFSTGKVSLAEYVDSMAFAASTVRLELFEPFIDRCLYDSILKNETLKTVKLMLRDHQMLTEHLSDLQNAIELLRFYNERDYFTDKPLDDYALLGCGTSNSVEDVCNYLFTGERWFLYSYLEKIYNRKLSSELTDLFYAYLLIKEGLRSELIQSNGYVGFENFQQYERRKMQLTDDRIYKSVFAKNAVRENLLNKNIKSIEIRVSPCDTAFDNFKLITNLDKIIGDDKSKYFYTLHFIKKPDSVPKHRNDPCNCRHYEFRRSILRKTYALVKLRTMFPSVASRIRGIDAASQEIGCRPEVFGTCFRYLRNHVVSYYSADSSLKNLPQLHTTYHVGEDFLDVADGLRAIDEAIEFLRLNCGDRLGHAIALGIDVQDWYSKKNNKVVLTQQDYLDNIVWIYRKLIDLNVDGTAAFRSWLEKEFDLMFQQIYSKNISSVEVRDIIRNANESQKTVSSYVPLTNSAIQFGLNHYYQAWRLRGDDPELYRQGYFDWNDNGSLFSQARITKRSKMALEMRSVPEAFILNYMYHFNTSIRIDGSRMIEVNISPMYIDGVSKLQKAMQRLISAKGISVETNPSSNYHISTFKDYTHHPIFNFYNKNLTYDPDKLSECPQLSVSINTDDMGVFSTSLENEYSLLAYAKEHEKDCADRQIYSKSMVYSWLNDVRKMGLTQSFGEL